VQVEQRPQLVLGRLLHRPDLGPAGVVDEHVDAAEAVERGADRGVDLVWAGDVERDGEQAVGGVEVERLGAPGGGDDVVAAGERGRRDVAPEARRAAGDEPGLHGAQR
jgi:hypothetical protein